MQSTTHLPTRLFDPGPFILAALLALAAGLPWGGASLSAAPFLRGDASGDSVLDITDPIVLLGQLFTGGEPLPCLDAADADDSGLLDISDPIAILDHLYRGGTSPRAPFPAAGADPTPDALDCAGEAGDGLAGERLPGSEEDLAALGDPGPVERSSREGDPLLVDGSTFDALRSLADGQPLAAALGAGAEPFLTAFFRGRPPVPPPAGLAADAIAPLGPGGCFLVPAALIDRRSQAEAVDGQFRRGDVNADGRVDADDARIIVDCLDGGPCPLSCWDAADANDDGRVTLSDAGRILAAAEGEEWLPGPAGACGFDPTPDELPPCSGVWCASGAPGRTLEARPEAICRLGAHPVELIAIDEDGGSEADTATMILCPAGEFGCGGAPKPLALDGEPTAPAIACRWIVAIDRDPEEVVSSLKQTCFEDGGEIHSTRHAFPLTAWGGGMEIFRTDNGPGPVHYLHTNRMAANCHAPPTQLSFSESGKLEVRVNIICLNSSGTLSTCHSTAEVEGTYSSRVEAGTSAGPDCRRAPNSVDALAQDEATFKVNSQTLFAKAVAVENGNEVTTSPSFSTHFDASLGKNGLAADVGVNFGYSSSVVNHTGQAEDQLEAFGNTAVNLPLTANLQAKGRVQISAMNRTSARTKCLTRAAGIWLVARTDCPVGPLFVSEIGGEDSDADRARVRAESFRRSRMGQ